MRHLTKIKKPIVWTMRDMWPMTGGCHYSLNCENYKIGCGRCKQLNSKRNRDLSSWIVKRKKKYLPKSIKFVGISNWLSGEAQKSELLENFDIRTIGNNINTKEFSLLDKEIAKKLLGIKTNKKIILVGSRNLKDFYKGFNKYLEAIKKLDKTKHFLCFFGKLDSKIIENLGFEYKNFGTLYDVTSLRILYSASNVFIAPSIQEAFGKTLVEAMACGTPVVCFDATGPKDIITHKVDGYKAKPFKGEDLANGIEWVLNNKNYDKLCQNARKKVMENFDVKIIAEEYKKLYEKIINENEQQ